LTVGGGGDAVASFLETDFQHPHAAGIGVDQKKLLFCHEKLLPPSS